jgi:hypothetical protein
MILKNAEQKNTAYRAGFHAEMGNRAFDSRSVLCEKKKKNMRKKMMSGSKLDLNENACECKTKIK